MVGEGGERVDIDGERVCFAYFSGLTPWEEGVKVASCREAVDGDGVSWRIVPLSLSLSLPLVLFLILVA